MYYIVVPRVCIFYTGITANRNMQVFLIVSGCVFAGCALVKTETGAGQGSSVFAQNGRFLTELAAGTFSRVFLLLHAAYNLPPTKINS
jgi:uncharacterized protein YceK